MEQSGMEQSGLAKRMNDFPFGEVLPDGRVTLYVPDEEKWREAERRTEETIRRLTQRGSSDTPKKPRP